MRPRDVRAIAFCVITTVVLLAAATQLLHSLVVGLAITVAYDAWLLTRPRMIRVQRRLRGEPDWSGYFDNDGTRFNPRPASERPGPGTAPSPPRPAERS